MGMDLTVLVRDPGMRQGVSKSVGVSRKKGLGIDRKFHFSDLSHVNV